MNHSLFNFGIKHIEFLAVEYFKAEYDVQIDREGNSKQLVQTLFKKMKDAMDETAPLTDGGLPALEIMVDEIRQSVLHRYAVKTCDRCNGTGIFREYRHIQNGTCFKCKGEKLIPVNS